jgi:hypothetical protein
MTYERPTLVELGSFAELTRGKKGKHRETRKHHRH